MADRKHETGFDRQKNKQQKNKHPKPVPALEERYKWSSGYVPNAIPGRGAEGDEEWVAGSTRRDTWLRPSLVAYVSKVHQKKK